MMKLVTLFTLCFISLTQVFGRSPAVEPVTGISIDQYKEVDPAKDPGFNFKQSAPKQVSFRKPAGKRAPADYESGPSITTTIAFLTLVISFPIALWFTMMKAFPAAPTPTSSETPSAQTFDLAAERSKREDESENSDDIHKAS